MSVDTYLKRKDLSRYQAAEFAGVRILLSAKLAGWARDLSIHARRFLLWESLAVEVAPVDEHAHAGV